MTTYIFDTDAGLEPFMPVSHDLPSLEQAKVEAVKYLGALLSEGGSAFWIREKVTMTVSSRDGQALFSLTLLADVMA